MSRGFHGQLQNSIELWGKRDGLLRAPLLLQSYRRIVLMGVPVSRFSKTCLTRSQPLGRLPRTVLRRSRGSPCTDLQRQPTPMTVASQFQVQGFLSQTLLDVDSFPNLLASSRWRYWSATARWRGASRAQTHMATARHRRFHNMFGSNGQLNASTCAEGDNGCASA